MEIRANFLPPFYGNNRSWIEEFAVCDRSVPGMSVNRLSRLAATQCRSLSTLRDRAIQLEPKYLYEPKFEDPRVYPEYDLINVRLQGYDYVPLEKFQSYVHKIAKRFKFEIVESYAVAAKTERVVVYKPNSTLVESEIELATYDRVIRIAKVPTVRLPLFIFLIHTHLPIGVKLTVKGHEKADEDYRYIPDLLLKQKQEELKSLDDPLVRKNLGWE
ncbi:39S ribosomal protein L48, mitochondrial [Toxocara canis]|uniref:39S ribosomal protein L48, mitochondrial n=1 Tax=Toxocara canis TaxID=6265 RepID=A0A0B2VNL9_TOXCA|nr:39S ribosomal protein L48, mitochondrial [Toxocara canis]